MGPKPPPPPISAEKNARPPTIPPKKIQPDPDYEIIEFGQQYSNASPLNKNLSINTLHTYALKIISVSILNCIYCRQT